VGVDDEGEGGEGEHAAVRAAFARFIGRGLALSTRLLRVAGASGRLGSGSITPSFFSNTSHGTVPLSGWDLNRQSSI